MDYCGPRGLPLSQFLSWSEDDQQAALAWQSRDAARCKDCGTHAEDWDPEQGGSRDAYHVVIRECQGCVELQRTHDNPQLQQARGVHLHLSRR